MPRLSRYVVVSATIGLLLLFVSCDGTPTSPQPTPQPPQPAPVTVVRLELLAPSEIAPGESVQLTANAIKSDGSVENVSSQARWAPADSPILQVSSTGLATGKNRGDAFVSASFGSRNAGARIFVLPTGTFRLAGNIRESGFGIENVTVTVISGVGAGLTTLSGFGGSYAFYGVSGPVQIQLKKEGYLNAIQQVNVTGHRTADFDIVAERPRKDYTGTYRLTISAAPCSFTSGTLPDAAKSRVYTAGVAQDAGRLTVTLTDADFIVTSGYGNRFSGFVDAADAITFQIGDAYYYYYYAGHFDIVERFSTTALVINGTVSARGTPAVISGTLNGTILISNRSTPPFHSSNSRCYAPAHGFEMVRR
ncbi:MAG: hypothetical protein LC804_22880 [Acidobacteria bacterium]|nr:hypothetical protein [Acidobacteriota bacterium]